MQTIHDPAQLRALLAPWRSAGRRIALVPTMGNLHDGHLKLVRRARALADRVVASVFVNPLQFAPGEDYERYPRTLEVDALKLAEEQTDLLFAPAPEQVYPRPPQLTTRVSVPGLEDILCGASRPGHFGGVATVVTILFHMVEPQVAVFGEKDYQQLLLICRLAADLHLPIDIVGVPTVREPDGLALSSRNAYLSDSQRRVAPRLYAALKQVRERVLAGAGPVEAAAAGARELDAAGFDCDYFTVRRAADLEAPGPADRDLVVLAAARLGSARLIDNLRFSRPIGVDAEAQE
jgi:pantoate--beta-alanine ligase